MNELRTEGILKSTEISRTQRPARLLTERPPGVRRPGRRKYAEQLGDARPLSVASEPCGSTRNEPPVSVTCGCRRDKFAKVPAM